MTQDIAGVDRKQLGVQAYDLTSQRADITAAVDFVLSGI
ncbi:CcdB protein [Nitrincola nitratireducens]|uniref:CcdB protein n=2 Tax=Nitrincola nitratireducens TaxID=1229521 RepID=W9VNV7_9GAMM|nr:CcdB protein [Nitrincola nitratireducens]